MNKNNTSESLINLLDTIVLMEKFILENHVSTQTKRTLSIVKTETSIIPILMNEYDIDKIKLGMYVVDNTLRSFIISGISQTPFDLAIINQLDVVWKNLKKLT